MNNREVVRMQREQDPVRRLLRSYRAARLDMEHGIRALERAETMCTQITAKLSGMPGGGGDLHRDAAWAELADRRAELADLVVGCVQAEREVDGFVSKIDDATLRAVLRLRYIDDLSWERLAAKMNYSERQIYRLHGQALQAARRIWDEEAVQ